MCVESSVLQAPFDRSCGDLLPELRESVAVARSIGQQLSGTGLPLVQGAVSWLVDFHRMNSFNTQQRRRNRGQSIAGYIVTGIFQQVGDPPHCLGRRDRAGLAPAADLSTKGLNRIGQSLLLAELSRVEPLLNAINE